MNAEAFSRRLNYQILLQVIEQSHNSSFLCSQHISHYISLLTAGGLDQMTFKGLLQPKLIYDSMIFTY